jgi:hypothetical protein
MSQGILFRPTEEERKRVQALAGYGVPHENIAALIGEDGIDADTLKKHFRKELAQGKAKANARVGQTLFQKATGGDTTAAIWWSKTQMGWKDTQAHEISGPDGSAVKVQWAQ